MELRDRKYLGWLLLSLLTVAAVIPGCDDPEEQRAQLEALSGKWLLIDYFDSIAVHQTLEPHRLRTPIVFVGLLLEVRNDTLRTYGLMGHRRFVLKPVDDNLYLLVPDSTEQAGLQYADTLYHNAASGRIAVTGVPNRKTGEAAVLRYRRPYPNEPALTPDTTASDPFQLDRTLTNYFNRSLIAGEYRVLEGTFWKPETMVVLTPEGGVTVNGRTAWREYRVETFCGSLHPYKADALAFYPDLMSYSPVYHWKRRGDTLRLFYFRMDGELDYVPNEPAALLYRVSH